MMDLSSAKNQLKDIEAEESNACILWVKQCGYCMAERLGYLEKEKQESARKRRTVFEALKASGYSEKDIFSALPVLQEV